MTPLLQPSRRTASASTDTTTRAGLRGRTILSAPLTYICSGLRWWKSVLEDFERDKLRNHSHLFDVRQSFVDKSKDEPTDTCAYIYNNAAPNHIDLELDNSVIALAEQWGCVHGRGFGVLSRLILSTAWHGTMVGQDTAAPFQQHPDTRPASSIGRA